MYNSIKSSCYYKHYQSLSQCHMLQYQPSITYILIMYVCQHITIISIINNNFIQNNHFLSATGSCSYQYLLCIIIMFQSIQLFQLSHLSVTQLFVFLSFLSHILSTSTLIKYRFNSIQLSYLYLLFFNLPSSQYQSVYLLHHQFNNNQ